MAVWLVLPQTALAQNRPGLAWGLDGIEIEVPSGAPLALYNPTGDDADRLATRVSGVVRSGLRRGLQNQFIGNRRTRLIATVRRFEGPSKSRTLFGGGSLNGELDFEIRDALTGELLARSRGLSFSRRASSLLGVGRAQQETFIEEIALVTQSWTRSLGCADAPCTVASGIAPAAAVQVAAAPEPEPEPIPEPVPVPVATPQPKPVVEDPVIAAIDPVTPAPESASEAADDEDEGGFFSSIASVFDSDDEAEPDAPELIVAEPEPASPEIAIPEPTIPEPAVQEPEVEIAAVEPRRVVEPARPAPTRAPAQTRRQTPAQPQPAVESRLALAADARPPIPAPRIAAPQIAVPTPAPTTVALPTEPVVVEEDPNIALADIVPAPAPVEPTPVVPADTAPEPAPAAEGNVDVAEEPAPVVALADPVQPVPRLRVEPEPEPDPNEIAEAPGTLEAEPVEPEPQVAARTPAEAEIAAESPAAPTAPDPIADVPVPAARIDQPEPEPEPAPEPAADPEPEPEPVAEPAPAPEPEPAPNPAPVPEVAPEPAEQLALANPAQPVEPSSPDPAVIEPVPDVNLDADIDLNFDEPVEVAPEDVEVETEIAAADPTASGPTLANAQWIGFTPAVFGNSDGRPGLWIAGPFDRRERQGWITDTATGSTTRVTFLWREAAPGSQALLSAEAARALGLTPGDVANVAVYLPR